MRKTGNESADALYGETSTAAAVESAEAGDTVSDSAIDTASESAIDTASESAIDAASDAAISPDPVTPSDGAVTETSDDESEDDPYGEELSMIEELIRNQEYTLRTVYNDQEASLARLIDSMNEFLDTYAEESEAKGMVS
jgi:hypothetical protein